MPAASAHTARSAQQKTVLSRHELKAFLNTLPASFKQDNPIARNLVAGLVDTKAANAGASSSVDGVSIVEHTLPVGTIPIDIKNGPDGNVWFSTLHGMGEINPVTKQVNIYPSPITAGVPYAVNGGPGPYMYFTSLGVDGLTGNDIGRINVYTHQYQLFPIPTPFAYPADIKTGPDGNEWFSEAVAGKIGVFNTTTDQFTEFNTGLGSLPQDVATGEGSCQTLNQCPPGINTPGGPLKDGLVWYTLMGPVPGVSSKVPGLGFTGLPAFGNLPTTNGNALLSINPKTYAVHEYPYPTPAAGTLDVDPGPNNDTVWFAEDVANKLGYINTDTNQITEIPLPTPAALPFTVGAGPLGVTPAHAMFSLEQGANAVAMVTGAGTTNTVSQIAIPTPASVPIDLTQNSESKSVFFAEAVGNKIGEIVFPQSVK